MVPRPPVLPSAPGGTLSGACHDRGPLPPELAIRRILETLEERPRNAVAFVFSRWSELLPAIRRALVDRLPAAALTCHDVSRDGVDPTARFAPGQVVIVDGFSRVDGDRVREAITALNLGRDRVRELGLRLVLLLPLEDREAVFRFGGDLLAWRDLVLEIADARGTLELRVSLRRRGRDRLAVAWEGDIAPTEPFEGVLPLSARDLDEHRWYVERHLGPSGSGERVRAARVAASLSRWGAALYEVLASPGGAHPIQHLLQHPGPRILSLVTEDPSLLDLPWELLRSPAGPLVFDAVSIRRDSRVGRRCALQLPRERQPLRILLVRSHPDDLEPQDLCTEPMSDVLEHLGDRVELCPCDPPTLGELRRRLRAASRGGRPFRIVHFSGCGAYLPRRGVGAIFFEDDDAKAHRVDGELLGRALAAQGVDLVFIEAASTARQGARSVAALPPALLDAGVRSTVSFSHAMRPASARLLVGAFYAALGGGRSVGEALVEARRALATAPRRAAEGPAAIALHDWHLAVLYQRGLDPIPVPAGERAGAPPD